MAYGIRRTEHAGAKNGGGYWGKRADAKAGSRKRRRHADSIIAEAQMRDWMKGRRA